MLSVRAQHNLTTADHPQDGLPGRQSVLGRSNNWASSITVLSIFYLGFNRANHSEAKAQIPRMISRYRVSTFSPPHPSTQSNTCSSRDSTITDTTGEAKNSIKTPVRLKIGSCKGRNNKVKEKLKNKINWFSYKN